MTIIDTLREFRIGGYAIFDLAVSFIGIYLIAPLLSKLFSKIHVNIPTRSRLLLTLPLSILIHLGAETMTTMTRDVLDIHGHYGIKIVIIVCIIIGISQITFTKHKIK